MGDTKVKRDSKDPMPNSRNSARVGGGNEPYPSGAEKHGQSKAEKISPASRFDKNKPGPEQPRRNEDGERIHGIMQTGGNVPSLNQEEDHNQKKAERISASQRF